MGRDTGLVDPTRPPVVRRPTPGEIERKRREEEAARERARREAEAKRQASQPPTSTPRYTAPPRYVANPPSQPGGYTPPPSGGGGGGSRRSSGPTIIAQGPVIVSQPQQQQPQQQLQEGYRTRPGMREQLGITLSKAGQVAGPPAPAQPRTPQIEYTIPTGPRTAQMPPSPLYNPAGQLVDEPHGGGGFVPGEQVAQLPSEARAAGGAYVRPKPLWDAINRIGAAAAEGLLQRPGEGHTFFPPVLSGGEAVKNWWNEELQGAAGNPPPGRRFYPWSETTPVQQEMEQVRRQLNAQATPGTPIAQSPAEVEAGRAKTERLLGRTIPAEQYTTLGETISPALPQPERGQRGAGQRLEDLARAYAQEPGTIPPEMGIPFEDKGALAAYSAIPWNKLGFKDQAEGYSWVRAYKSKFGKYPWEGPDDEETNLGNAINSWFYGGEEGMFPPEIGYQDVTDQMIGPVGILYDPYAGQYADYGYGYGGYYGGYYPMYGGYGGGGSYENPWWWLYPGLARGI